MHKFVPTNEAIFFPEGTQNTFRTFVGPADFIETVNTIGLSLYSKLAIGKEFKPLGEDPRPAQPAALLHAAAVLVKGNKTSG